MQNPLSAVSGKKLQAETSHAWADGQLLNRTYRRRSAISQSVGAVELILEDSMSVGDAFGNKLNNINNDVAVAKDSMHRAVKTAVCSSGFPSDFSTLGPGTLEIYIYMCVCVIQLP